jgi:hypothetical protein
MSENGLQKRKAWVEWYAHHVAAGSIREAPEPGQLYRCPCCHCRTLAQRRAFIICPVCFWEDDGQCDADADVVRGGANGNLSLTAARQNYIRYGACDAKFVANVRSPLPDETDTEYTI